MAKFFGKIRKQLKHIFDGISNEKLKLNLLQAIPFWLASLVTGLVAVAYAKIFAWTEQGTGYLIHHHGMWMLIITPFCFLVSWWLIFRFAPFARGSGIPQVIAAVELATPKYNHMVDRLLNLKN